MSKTKSDLENIESLQLVETAPSAGRMALAIAGYPYSPKAAVLDLIDNSVEAGADGVAVLLEQADKELSSLIVADNGGGIHPSVLGEVLRAGSYTSHLYGEQSLSRYGIGLKGAGFSLGSHVTVLTRSKGEPLRRRSIDLDIIQYTDKWVQETRDPNAKETAIFESALSQLPGPGQRETGTVILVEKLNIRSRDTNRLKNETVRAVGETYAKFLSGEGGVSKIYIRVDGTDIEPVDPLHRENKATVVFFQREEIKLLDGVSLFFSAVALPHPNTVSAELMRNYRYTQADQGIYVYRNGRMVMGGQTLGLGSKDFHLNAFRAEIEYTTAADDHILVDVAKSNVNVSPEAAAALQEKVRICTQTAQTLWREKDVLTTEDIKGLFDESNRLISSRQKLLVDTARKRREDANEKNDPERKPTQKGVPKTRKDVPYLLPKDSLPEDVLYRPLYSGDLQNVVVEVNLSHPFSKAVFSVSPGEGKKAVPRKATTAAQQLLYILGHAEYSLAGDGENRQLLEQFRRYASMNLRALLAD
jgi:hypothetical protein